MVNAFYKLLLGCVLLWSAPVWGQSYLQFQTSRGHMLAPTEELQAIQGWPNFIKIDYATVLKTKEYHRHLNNPLSGVSLTLIDHGHEATGRSISISGFLQPTIVEWRKHGLSGRVSTGLSYVENPFDPIENPLQRAIGSNFNFFAEGQLIYTYDLSHRINLNLLGGITHISNGARKLPNTGINILSAGLGASYRIDEESKPPISRFNSPELDYKLGAFSHYVFVRGGLKSIRNLDFDVFPAIGLSYTAAYRYHPLGSFLAGIDVDYNEGFIRERLAQNQTMEESTAFTRWRWAIAVGHELHMNKLSLITQYGFYLRRPEPNHRLAYQRYGLKYHLTSKTVVAVTLRAHAGRADYMEWTIGRRF